MLMPTQQNAGQNHDDIKIMNKSFDNVGNSNILEQPYQIKITLKE
jgi:hypothetical protein